MRELKTYTISTFKCDRCGTERTQNEPHTSPAGFPVEWSIVDFEAGTVREKSYDLCESCTEAFVGFIRGEILSGGK